MRLPRTLVGVYCFWCLSLISVDLAVSFAGRFPTSRQIDGHHCSGLQRRSPAMASMVGSSDELPRGEREWGMTERRELDVDPDEVETDFCEVVDDFGIAALESFNCEDTGEENFRWIRVEKETDECLKYIKTRDDVLNKMAEVREEQGRLCRTVLRSYPLYWENVNSDNPNSINGESTGESSKNIISVMQFNMLAEGLSAGPSVKTPFRINPNDSFSQRETKAYGGFSHIPQPHISLDFSLRRWRLLEVILGTQLEPRKTAGSFDLIALEEIDRYRGFFAPVLRLFGYDGIFMPKIRSPGVRMGWYSDGCALFWKKDTFELVSKQTSEYKVGSQVMVIAVLRHRPTGRKIVTAVTHLKAQKSEENEMVRCKQVDELLEQVDETARAIAKRDKVNDVPVLILGDFNADPPSLRKQESNESLVGRVLERFRRSKSSVGRVLKFSRRRFSSAYEIDPPPSTFYTTWKTRGTSTARRIIDYIFFSGCLRCKATLCIPTEEELEDTKLPGLVHPSDHLHVAAKFEIE